MRFNYTVGGRMKLSFCLLVSSTLLVSSVATAQSVAGTWNATVTTPNGGGSPTLTFVVKGDSVSGTVKRPTGEVVPLKGTIKGTDLTYSYTIQAEGQSVAVTVKAKVAGDSLSGTMDFAGQMTGQITAKRAPKPKG
jgi:hypothetical protein